MRHPLLVVAIGLAITAIYDARHGWDLLPDPIGWLLILAALIELTMRLDLAQRRTLWVLGIGATLAAGVLWVPAIRDSIANADPSLGWAIELPRFTFFALLCHSLSVSARDTGTRVATGWASWTAVGFIVCAIAPIVVVGGGVESMAGPTSALIGLSQVSLFVLCLVYATKVWAGAAPTPAADEDV